ncbi:Cytochrome P450 9e2 [Orchesella cincta]|uniref:Cytochrome P450 9e2 n=1 Tax=Orchesella cincta TaxID=48709 RepID=A0A1D2MLR9_ORCCI|nr:Cytochrome P450 9e2 [Orchesella cincta]
MWLALISVVVIGFLAYKLLSSSSKNFFKEHGIREIDTSKAVSQLDIFLGRKGLALADDYAYKTMGSDKFCGISEMGHNLIIIKDMELMKKILIKDFDHFVDRRDFFSDAEISFKKMLPSLKGDEWKGVRSSVSPTFSSGKIRRMMDCFNNVGIEWVNNFKEKAKASPDGSATIEAMSSVNQYTIDVIASAVFGMQSGTIKNPQSPFATMAARMSEPTKWQLMKFTFFLQFPKLASKVMKIRIIDEEARTFFEGILEQGLKARMSGSTTKRNDFLQLLVEAKKGELKAEGNDELNSFEKDAQIQGSESGEKKQWLTDQIMNSQSLVFFIAGFSTTSNAIIFAAYALAIHQDVQDRLRKEVSKIAKPDGSFDYDDLSTLVYMEMVLCEVLRKFPAAARLERKCVKDYKDSESGLFVPQGTTVGIPAYSIHCDPKYYENPDKFDPEHFSPEKKAERSPYAYMPFGIGPRNCIGMRFALVETKAALAHLVNSFRIEPTKKTPIPAQGKWVGFGLLPPKGLELKLTPLTK